VAAAERRVVAVGEAKARFGQAMPQRAQHARLADAGLAGEQDVAALVARLDESFDDALARARDPEVRVRDVFAERRAHQTEMFEPLRRGHRAPPTSASRRAPFGSNGTGAKGTASMPRAARLDVLRERLAFARGSTGRSE